MARPTTNYFMLVILSALIASIGLLQNSAAVIIGAAGWLGFRTGYRRGIADTILILSEHTQQIGQLDDGLTPSDGISLPDLGPLRPSSLLGVDNHPVDGGADGQRGQFDALRKLRRDALEEEPCQVLGSRIDAFKPRDVDVEVVVVDIVNHGLMDDRLEVLHVDQVSALGVHVAPDRELDHVVVAVAVRVVALAVDAPVLLGREGVVAQDMGSGEAVAARELDHARAAGAAELPPPIRRLMRLTARVMTRSAYWV